jgi:predicted Zn-dependent protease
MIRNHKLCFALLAGVLLGLSGRIYGGEARVRISDLKEQVYVADDVQAEIIFGRHLSARILARWPLWDHPKANRYVNLVGRGLAFFAGRSELKFSFGLLDTDAVNAFAVPGGYVFITRGALERMTDEAQLAAVIGHEMAHINERHMVRELCIDSGQGSSFAGLTALVGGATGGVRGALESSLDQAAQILFNRGYKIKDELEADRMGLLLAATAGYDPWALHSFLKSAGRFEPAAVTATKDHPELSDRLAAMAATISDNGLDDMHKTTMRERFNEMVSHP